MGCHLGDRGGELRAAMVGGGCDRNLQLRQGGWRSTFGIPHRRSLLAGLEQQAKKEPPEPEQADPGASPRAVDTTMPLAIAPRCVGARPGHIQETLQQPKWSSLRLGREPGRRCSRGRGSGASPGGGRPAGGTAAAGCGLGLVRSPSGPASGPRVGEKRGCLLADRRRPHQRRPSVRHP